MLLPHLERQWSWIKSIKLQGAFPEDEAKPLFPRARYGKIYPSEGMHHYTGVLESQAA